MKTVAVVIGVSRSNLIERLRERPKKRIGQPPLPDGKLVAEIKAVIAELPTYGYRRVHAILKRRALATGLKPPNHKRVYRVMKVHGLLLDRHAGGVERRHDGRIAVDERNRRWCSDGFEIGCDNGERVRVAFALDSTMAAVTSPARHAASLATSASNRERRQSKVHRAMEWPKPSSVRSSVTTSGSVRARMHRPSCTSYQLGLITTTRFTRTRHSDIVHPVSSSQLTEARDRVRSFGGYNRHIRVEAKTVRGKAAEFGHHTFGRARDHRR